MQTESDDLVAEYVTYLRPWIADQLAKGVPWHLVGAEVDRWITESFRDMVATILDGREAMVAAQQFNQQIYPRVWSGIVDLFPPGSIVMEGVNNVH